MRSPGDLIAELNREARKFDVLSIAVGFAQHTRFVFPQTEDPQGQLDRLVQAGGKPIGLVGLVKTAPGSLTLVHRPFAEYRDQPWVQGYLESLAEALTQAAVQSGAAREIDLSGN